jgi:hypothetical protein
VLVHHGGGALDGVGALAEDLDAIPSGGGGEHHRGHEHGGGEEQVAQAGGRRHPTKTIP